MKKLLTLVMCLCMILSSTFSVNATELKAVQKSDEVLAAELTKEMSIIESELLERVSDKEKAKTFQVTYQQKITADVIKESREKPVKVYSVTITDEEDSSKSAVSGTKTWGDTDTYVINGNLFNLGAEMIAIKHYAASTVFYELDSLEISWSTSNSFDKYATVDTDGYCNGTSEEVSIKQAGVSIDDPGGRLEVLPDVNYVRGIHSLSMDDYNYRKSFTGREPLSLPSVGFLASQTTFNIQSADYVINGTHYGVKNYEIEYQVGEGWSW